MTLVALSLIAQSKADLICEKLPPQIPNSTSAKDSLVDPLVSWFQGGNIDFISSGLLRSSANVLLINVGHPRKFHLPFYLLIGATTDLYQDSSSLNESSLADLLNNHGGFINFGINGHSPIKKYSRKSALFLTYQAGGKSISGVNLEMQEHIGFLSKMLNLGLMYHTVAWKPGQPREQGRAWIKSYFSISKNGVEEMKGLFGSTSQATLYGFNFEGGVELENYINIRFGYYEYLNNQHIPVFQEGVFKLAADFIIPK